MGQPKIRELWAKRLERRPPPQVRVMGRDPNEWEADFPDMRSCKNGAKFSVTFGPDTPEEEAVVWKLEEDGADPDEEDDETFYAIAGTFNSILEIPDSGALEFRILKDSEPDKVIAPATPDCSRKSEKIEGPAKDLKNKWVVKGPPGAEI